MEEQYPLILDGREAGVLSVKKEGGWTLFDVRSESAEGIVRVSVYGTEGEGYLGVLAPEGEGLGLHRRLSRRDLQGFPAKIEYAGRAGEPRPAAQPPSAETVQAAENTPRERPTPEEACVPAAAPEETELQDKTEAPEETENAPPELADVYWYASPDGALVCFDGERNLIALPVGDARIPEGGGGWTQTIEGRDYIVYRTKDGRLLR